MGGAPTEKQPIDFPARRIIEQQQKRLSLSDLKELSARRKEKAPAEAEAL
jgi:hypothetical protein